MLKSQAWRHRARKTSALGFASTLVVFAGAVLGLSSPAQAAAAASLKVTYDCTGGALADTVDVTVTAPTSVEPSKPATIEWAFAPITVSEALPLGETVTVKGADLTVQGATQTTIEGSGNGTSPAVSVGQNYTPPKMTATVNVGSTVGGNLVLTPVSMATSELLTFTVGDVKTTCTYESASPANISVPIQAGSGNGNLTDLVQYRCVGPETTNVQNVEIKVTLTMPTSAAVNQQMIIKWRGVYTQGKELKAPATGQTISPKIFAYASLTGITNLTSATGEGTTGTIVANQPIPLPTQDIELKTTSTTAGTATVKPAAVNFGANSATGNIGNTPSIQCAVQNASSLKTYTLTVGNSTPSPTPTATTTSPRPTLTTTATVTVTPSSATSTRSSRTPKAGADTGAGGMAGPDGRTFILTGTALIAAAAVGGLVMRRRAVRS